MEISFVKEPENTTSTDQAIVFRWKSNDRMTPEIGALYYGNISAYDLAPLRKGELFSFPYVTFAWGKGRINMYPVGQAIVNSRALYEHEYSIVNTNATKLAEAFKKNTTLNRDFDITAVGDLVEFRARAIGNQFNLDTTLNPKINTRILGSIQKPEKRENFKFFFELFFRHQEGPATFEKIFSSEVAEELTSVKKSVEVQYWHQATPPSGKGPTTGAVSGWRTRYEDKLVDEGIGIAEIDIREKLQIALSTSPPASTAKKYIQSQAIGEYYCQITEMYGTPAVARNIGRSSVKKATMSLLQKDPLLLEQPEVVSFSGNPMIFKLQSWTYLDTYASTFVGSLELPKVIFFSTISGKQKPCFYDQKREKKVLFPDDFKLEFRFSDTLVSMIAVDKPDNSGDQFPNTAVSVAELLPYFKANYTLDKYYSIELDALAGKIRFTARQPGARYNWKSGVFLNNEQIGVDFKERENFTFLFELFFQKQDATDFECIYSEQILQDIPLSGLATIDVSSILDAFLDYEIPDFNASIPMRCSQSKGAYFCQFAEIYGSTPRIKKVIKSNVKHVLKGGLSHVGFKTKNLLSLLSPAIGNPSQDRFLNDGPRVIRTYGRQAGKLYFINMRANITMLKLLTCITYNDESSGGHESEPMPVKQYDKLAFDVGINLFKNSKEIKSYTCYLVNEALEQVSEKISFQPDYSLRAPVRYFAYSTSLGGFKTLLTYGTGSQEYELNSQTANTTPDVKRALYDRYKSAYNIRLTSKFTVSTGWINKDQFFALADFFLAEKKFIIKHNMLLPIVVSSKKVCETSDLSALMAQTFEYQYAFDERKYTEEIEDFNCSPTTIHIA